MPRYNYECKEHGYFTVSRKVDDRKEPCKCPECKRECPYTPTFETLSPVFKGSGFHSTDYNVKEGEG